MLSINTHINLQLTSNNVSWISFVAQNGVGFRSIARYQIKRMRS